MPPPRRLKDEFKEEKKLNKKKMKKKNLKNLTVTKKYVTVNNSIFI